MKEERHNVNLSLLAEDGGAGDGVLYQRVCVGTEDGGVISLDWPEDLDMGKEHGLDTTVLIVPGTVEGSMDRDVRRFVCDALMHGCFPIVLNPRGCAGSPLTTARLFTAADSDDICAAVQFVNRSRPWTTLMGVGWGYGANMLTKYLAEVGVKTPLTAAVCIDNPFDLEEATRSFTTHAAFNPKLRSGLIDILRANKELFQGKAKGFDVAKALSAKSIRDFDEAISMVSYGFSDISDFYSKTSTGQSVSSVKIPVLFIQSVDNTVSALSVSRSSIAENPFTSLLLCSCLPSTISRSKRFAIHWCQHIAIEWLSAVEFALLKGRHPLLKDVDITINPSKGPTFIDGIASDRSISKGSKAQGSYKPNKLNYGQKNINGDTFMKLTQSDSVNRFLIDAPASVKDGAVQDKFNHHPKPGTELYGVQRKDVGTKQDGKGDISRENDSLAKEEADIPIDSEGSQVLQSATIVMNMLNVTMPGVLQDEQKKKVLSAMEQGETLMKALEGAVPDEVRGKLTTAANEILQTQGTKLNLDGLKRIGWNPHVASEVSSRIQEKLKGISTRENGHETLKSDERATGAGVEGITQDGSVLPGNSSKQESIASFEEKAVQVSGSVEAGSEEEIKQRQDTEFEKSSNDGEEGSDEYKANQSNEMTNSPSVSDQGVVNDINDVQKNDGKKMDSVAEQHIPASNPSSDEEIPAVSSTTEQQGVQKDGTKVQKDDGKMVQDAENHVQSKPPSISVTQALDAITGFDDSTQMAVNSVFGVLENMIDQFEKSSNQEADEESNKKDQESVDVSHELPPVNEDKSEKILNGNNTSSVGSDVIHASDQKETSFHENGSDSHGKTDGNRDVNQESKVGSSLSSSAKYSISRFPEKSPVKVAVSPHWESPYGTYFRRYLSAQLPINRSIDLDSATDLFLDPEEGQWKMPNQAGNTKSDRDESREKQRVNIFSRQDDDDDEDVIEPSYVILDSEHSGLDHQLNEECDTTGCSTREHDAEMENLLCLIRDAVMDSLKTEICRRSGMLDLSELDSDLVDDLEHVSETVSRAVVRDTELKLYLLSKHSDDTLIKIGTIDGENVTRTISCAMQEANHLRKVVPVGVVVGTCLALLRNYFEVAAVYDDGNRGKANSEPETMKDTFQEGHIKTESHRAGLDNLNENSENTGTESLNNDRIMVGAVTAALGASVLLANHQHTHAYKHENSGTPSGSYNGKDFPEMEQEEMQEKSQIGLVGSLAEKAMSVAGPVVPTKSDGGVDQDRLVAILAELGQKGGILRLVGKLALLWGGVRGAMSLTEKLISFLHIAERPLFQRILGFVGMVLVLWTPVVIPLLPTLVQNWTTNTSNGIAQSACIVGLYIAIMFLVILWGKRVRGYDNPFEQYGLDFRSASRVHEFTMGLTGGVTAVLCINSVNVLLGFARLSWPLSLTPSSADVLVLVNAYGSVLLQAVRGIVQAACVAVVEELMFRSWLAEEVAVDLGYYRAVMLSGIAFSLAQRSLPSVPAFLLLSLALFGIKQRANNKLSATIGLRAGIMSTNFFMRSAGFLTYQSNTPFWLSSIHLWHPFGGAVGLSFCAAMAILFFPRPPSAEENLERD